MFAAYLSGRAHAFTATSFSIMNKRTAEIISTVGNPFLLFPLILSLLVLRGVDIANVWPLLATTFAIIAILLIFLYIKKQRGAISNWDVSKREERSRNIYLPILILVGAAAIGFYVLRQPYLYETLFFGLLITVCYAINARVKISLHTVMATYLSVLVLSVNLWAGILLTIFSGFIGFSRVVLGRHTRLEVVTGVLVGVLFGLLHAVFFNQ